MAKKNDGAPFMPGGLNTASGLMQQNAAIASQMFQPLIAANITLLHWNAENCKRMAQAYSQMFDFIGHRLEEDASFAERLQASKDPKGVSDACSAFFEKAAKDYRDEVTELAKLTRGMAGAASDALQDLSARNESGAVMGE